MEPSLNIPFERSWNVPQEHSENIALERSKNRDIFLVLGTFLERSNGTFRTFHGNVHRTFREGIVLWGLEHAGRKLPQTFDGLPKQISSIGNRKSMMSANRSLKAQKSTFLLAKKN